MTVAPTPPGRPSSSPGSSPILEARCLKCHGREPKIRATSALDSREAILRGGDQGPAVTPRSARGEPVPPGHPLRGPGDAPVRQAAPGRDRHPHPLGQGRPPLAGRPAVSLVTKSSDPIRGTDPRPPVRTRKLGLPAGHPSLGPTDQEPSWVRNPIDAFILAGLESEGLEPAGPADRVALIRRVTYDLTGLPPTPEEVDAFVADPAPDAYERLVDRLLASPHYGETWGRHWLDLVRYAETNGYERDSAKPFAWRYRDYVIDAFNRDKPYDRFLREQLAGDEIDPGSAEAWIATGFYRLGIWDDEPADRPLARYDGLDGIVSTTGQVFLGLSINCARCHDHKKDPIPQRDYYRLLAFFHDVTHQDGRNTRKVGPAPGVDVMCVREQGRAETHVLLRGNPEPGRPQGRAGRSRDPGRAAAPRSRPARASAGPWPSG